MLRQLYVLLFIMGMFLLCMVWWWRDWCHGANKPNVKIVYFAHIRHGVWEKIVGGQMRDLKSSGLLRRSPRPHIVLTGNKPDIDKAEQLIKKIIGTDFDLTTSYANHYEYLGIKTMHEEAQKQSPDTIFLYFHSKGMVFQHLDDHSRTIDEQVVFEKMVMGWKKILAMLDDHPGIDKVCYGASSQGWCWYNFFWVRGRLLRRCKEPTIHDDDRFYFEQYIGTECFPTSYEDCINVMGEEKQKGLNMVEITNILVEDKNAFEFSRS